MRRTSRSTTAALAALTLLTPGRPSSQLSVCSVPPPTMRFDMQAASGTLPPNFVEVSPSTLYRYSTGYPGQTSPSNYGVLNQPTLGTVTTSSALIPAEVVHNHHEYLLQDSMVVDPPSGSSSGSLIFRVDRPAGEYMCVAYLGKIGEALKGMDIAISTSSVIPPASSSFTTVVSGAFARLQAPFSRANLYNAWGGYKRVTFSVTVGSLQCMNIRYDHNDHRLESALGDSAVDASLASFNAYDYGQAELDIAAMPTGTIKQKLAKAWAYGWLIGWLTDAQEQIDFDLIDDAQAVLGLLPSDVQANNWAAAGLAQDLDDLELGALYLKHSGYSLLVYDTNHQNFGYIGKNMKAGLQLCEQMDGDLLLGADNPNRPESPLCAKAQYLAARSMYERNTRLIEVADANPVITPEEQGSIDYNTYFVETIFGKLWARLDPEQTYPMFPKGHEAILVAYRMATAVPPTGAPGGNVGPGPLDPWDESFPDIDYSETWWHDLVDYSGPSVAPRWVQEQRRYAHMIRNVGKWWMDNRLEEPGELGGGGGDDTEGAAIFSLPLIARTEGPGHQPEDGIRKVMENVLFGLEVDQGEAYYLGPLVDDPLTVPEETQWTDPEHGGEYTTYPLFALVPQSPGNPRYLEFAMRNMRNLDPNWTGATCLDDNCWTGIPPGHPTYRHCKTSGLSACKIATSVPVHANEDQDALETMKVLAAGFQLFDHNRHGRLAELWRDYGNAWRGAALSTQGGKPLGIFPASVDFSDGTFGSGGSWWKADPAPNAAEMYELLLQMCLAYSNSQYVEPIDLAVQFLIDNPPGADPNAAEGTAHWTANVLGGVIATAAYRAWSQDCLPLGGGSASGPEVEFVISHYAPPALQIVHLARLQNDGLYSGTTFAADQAANKGELKEIFRVDASWLEHYWPFATTAVTGTDRVFVFPPKKPAQIALHAVLESQTGAPLILAPVAPVTWNDSDGGSELDFSILVTHLKASAASGNSVPPAANTLAFRALLWNHSSAARDINLRVCRDLPLGSYRLLRGEDTTLDDVIDAFDTNGTTGLVIPVDERFQDLTISAVPPGVLHVVELYKVSTIAGCTRDLAISADDLSIVAGELHVKVHNLGASSVVATTGGGYKVRVTHGSTTETEIVATIPAAFTTLTPATPVDVNTHVAVSSGHVTVELVVPAGICQITSVNDIASKDF